MAYPAYATLRLSRLPNHGRVMIAVRTFREALETCRAKGRPYTTDVRQMAAYSEDEVRLFVEESYWYPSNCYVPA